MRRTLTLAFALLTLTAGLAQAAEFVTPTRPLPIYQTAPGAYFQGKGAQIGTAQPNERCEVLQRATVPVLLRSEEWLRIRIARSPTPIEGWIFAGAGGAPATNVAPLSQ